MTLLLLNKLVKKSIKYIYYFVNTYMASKKALMLKTSEFVIQLNIDTLNNNVINF